LGEQPAEGMADDDRRPVEAADDLLVAADDVRDAEISEQRLVAGPVLPAERRHPHSVDQHDRLGTGPIRSSRAHRASREFEPAVCLALEPVLTSESLPCVSRTLPQDRCRPGAVSLSQR
jgi:hypothetical protein